jgi:hypothetical protein
VDPQNTSYSSLNGVLFDKGQSLLIEYPGSLAGGYTIPSSVTAIGDSAFFACQSLTSVTMPDSVTAIGDSAFGECASLTNVTIPDSVGNIPNFAFSDCASLNNVIIPNSVTNIGQGAFWGCSNLTSVAIPDVTSIGEEAFLRCSSLTVVTIPSSVTGIGDYAFDYCRSLEAITVDPQNTSYSSLNGVLFDKTQSSLVKYPEGLAGNYAIPSSVTAIGSRAFDDCTSLTGVTIPNNVTSIGDFAFSGCTSLAGVIIPSSVTAIGYSAFSECASLTNVAIPTSVSNIGEEPFQACRSLTGITVDPQNPAYSSLNGVLFDNTQSLLVQYPAGLAGSYAIPNGVTTVGTGAFYDCTGLTSVSIPASVTSIDDLAFYGCTSLTSVTIPASVTSLWSYVFWDCTSLAGAYFQGNPPSTFGPGVFDGTAPNFTIYYPRTATGWTTPFSTWSGYRAQPYDYPPGQRPILSLMQGLGAVTPLFENLQVGTNYQLQVSTDLGTWSNTGPLFTATNASEAYAQPFDVRNSMQLFFRLKSAP